MQMKFFFFFFIVKLYLDFIDKDRMVIACYGVLCKYFKPTLLSFTIYLFLKKKQKNINKTRQKPKKILSSTNFKPNNV